MTDETWTTVEITVARTDGTSPANLVPNSSRIAIVDGVHIRGEHVLQISERLPLEPSEQVQRVVAHGLARLIDAHQQASINSQYPGHEPNALLSPDDRGRIAEIDVLARAAKSVMHKHQRAHALSW